MFYALATDPDYWVDRVNLFVALAPVVNLSNTESTFFKVHRKDGWNFSYICQNGKLWRAFQKRDQT